jgi:Orsellinic acid/F9775 biosynthesis cluster protein D
MDYHVIYNAEHKVLICREHKCGVPRLSMDRHFRMEHKAMTLETRKSILAHVQTLELCDPEDVTIFDERTIAIQSLEICDGFRCEFPGCGSLAGTLGTMKKHCIEHDWEGFFRDSVRYNKVKLQTFFPGRHHLR